MYWMNDFYEGSISHGKMCCEVFSHLDFFEVCVLPVGVMIGKSHVSRMKPSLCIFITLS